MKRSLLFSRYAVSIYLLSVSFIMNGQTLLLSEDFSGFTTGSHTSPSTSDVSGSLDSRTHTPGWAGFKVYSAGGEIKISTSEIAGWIETPQIDFSGYSTEIFLKFDISRWPGDATSVKILINGVQLGELIEPADEYKTVSIPIASGIASGKIRFESQAKRFYLDNLVIFTDEVTSVQVLQDTPVPVLIYPNPVRDIVTLSNIQGCVRFEILDAGGRIHKIIVPEGGDKIDLSLADLPSSVYFIKIFYRNGYISRKLVKY